MVPENQVAMLGRVSDGHGTRSARGGLYVSTWDHRSVGYRVPKEWGSLGERQRGLVSLGSFKRESRAGFLTEYGAFVCTVRGGVMCVVWGVGQTGVATCDG